MAGAGGGSGTRNVETIRPAPLDGLPLGPRPVPLCSRRDMRRRIDADGTIRDTPVRYNPASRERSPIVIAVLRQSWALLLGMLLLMLGNGLQGTLLGVRGSLERIDASTMGYIMSAYFVGFLLGSRAAPWMLQRVGHVRVFAALGSLVSAAFILYGAVVDPLAWTALRLVVGFCFSGIYVVAESWLNHSSTNETRGQALSLYMIVQMGGMVLGQLLLNVADPAGYGLFVLITVLVSISFAPMLLSSSPAPRHQSARAMPIATLIRTSPLAATGMLLLGGVFSALYAMASVYATERGLSVANTSLFITAIFLGGSSSSTRSGGCPTASTGAC